MGIWCVKVFGVVAEVGEVFLRRAVWDFGCQFVVGDGLRGVFVVFQVFEDAVHFFGGHEITSFEAGDINAVCS